VQLLQQAVKSSLNTCPGLRIAAPETPEPFLLHKRIMSLSFALIAIIFV